MRFTKKHISKVYDEIEGIKKYASKEQIEKLSAVFLKPDSKYSCIYGLMTGNCFSEEAFELIKKCTVPFVDRLPIENYNTKHCNVLRLKKWDKVNRSRVINTSRMFTPLEFFITAYPHNNVNIIRYLKGDIQELELTLKNGYI